MSGSVWSGVGGSLCPEYLTRITKVPKKYAQRYIYYMTQSESYFSINFGREKEFYVIFLRHSEIKSFEDFERDFQESVMIAVNQFVDNGIRLSKYKGICSDYSLIHDAIVVLMKNGYKLIPMRHIDYFQHLEWSTENDDQNNFHMRFDLINPDGGNGLCAISINSGIYCDDFEFSVIKFKNNFEAFENDCTRLQPHIQKIVADNQLKFLEDFCASLETLGHHKINFGSLEFYSRHSISDYWEDIIGKVLFRALIQKCT